MHAKKKESAQTTTQSIDIIEENIQHATIPIGSILLVGTIYFNKIK